VLLPRASLGQWSFYLHLLCSLDYR
jgi:hypothetical protein